MTTTDDDGQDDSREPLSSRRSRLRWETPPLGVTSVSDELANRDRSFSGDQPSRRDAIDRRRNLALRHAVDGQRGARLCVARRAASAS